MVQLPGVAGVPTARPGPRLPALQAPRDNTGAALEAVGQLVSQEGDRLAAAEQRVRTREDTLARVRAGGTFNTNSTELLRKFETERDPNDPSGASKFGADLQKNMDEAVAAHSGSAESKAQLTIDLEQARAKFVGQAATMINEQDALLIENSAQAAVDEVAASVEGSVTGVEAGFFRLDRMLDNLAPAMTEDELNDRKKAGRAQVVLSAAQPLVDQATPESADAIEALIKRKDVQAALGSEQLRKLRGNVITIRAKADKGRIAGEQRLAEKAAIIGISPDEFTPAQKLKIAGLAGSDRQTLSDKITELQSVMGPDFVVTEQMITKLAGATVGDESSFGKGLAGLALNRVTRDATAFANGMMAPQDEQLFISSIVELQQPVSFQNPDTGLIETRTRTLAPFIIEALRRRGRDDLIAKVAGGPSDDGSEGPQVADGETIFEMARKVTGPVPAAMEALGQTPVIGEFVDAASFTRARKQVELLTRDLVRVLQNSPRFNEGERASIAKEVDLTGSVIDTPKAFRDRIIGMDDALAIRELNAFEASRSRFVSGQERRQALDVLNAITKFRARLGAPPLVKTPEEAGQLPSGTVFRSPDGVVRRVP